MTRKKLYLKSCSNSNIGNKRKNNQDSIYSSNEQQIYLVADGMGGLHDGKLAGQLAVQNMAKNIHNEHPIHNFYAHILNAVILTNQNVYNFSQKHYPGQKMGTTLSALVIHQSRYYVAHIGDSRCYLFRKEKLIQITEDQTLEQKIKKSSTDNSRKFLKSKRHILTQAIGVKESCSPIIYSSEVKVGDLFLLCTDGLHNAIKNEVIETILGNNANDLDKLSEDLLSHSLEKDGSDNISYIIVQVQDIL